MRYLVATDNPDGEKEMCYASQTLESAARAICRKGISPAYVWDMYVAEYVDPIEVARLICLYSRPKVSHSWCKEGF